VTSGVSRVGERTEITGEARPQELLGDPALLVIVRGEAGASSLDVLAGTMRELAHAGR